MSKASIAYTRIIDISLPLNTSTLTYPGNPEVEVTPVVSTSGTSVHSKIILGSHTGTHVDAPSHVFPQAATLDALGLDAFIGTCRVIDCVNEEQSVSKEYLHAQQIQPGERILLKTKNSERGFSEFREDYIFLSSEAARYLAECSIALIGIDSLSIKQKGSQDHTPHTAFLERSIPIIEGLNLADVQAGEYVLAAQPLAFTGIDGSPLRAVLLV